MSNTVGIEELMRNLVRSSVALKHKLYRRDETASTTPEGTDGPSISVHICRVCGRAAAGKEAHVRHKSDCPLAMLQRAHRAIHGAWPELFRKPDHPAKDTAPANPPRPTESPMPKQQSGPQRRNRNRRVPSAPAIPPAGRPDDRPWGGAFD